LFNTVHKNRIQATWFVDVKSQEKSLHSYLDMRKQEIGIHCYEHLTYPDYERNIQNIRIAQTALRAVKLNAKGFAAPYGEWNEELGRAIVDCGFEYSSEFSYDYDNLPSIPRFQESGSVLQVPVHPICIGSLRRHGYSDQQMIRYFKDVIRRKLALYEPIIFYHHPGDGHLGVLNRLFREIRHKQVPVKPMGEYARWWKLYLASIPEIRYTNKSIYLHRFKQEKSLYVRIVRPNGTEAVIPASKHIVLNRIRWSSKRTPWIMQDDYLRARRFNYRMPFVQGFDAVMNFFRRHKP
jgi:peptidoglycan/xylan/chitin deacetylase (PgdA/CDA1 family)